MALLQFLYVLLFEVLWTYCICFLELSSLRLYMPNSFISKISHSKLTTRTSSNIQWPNMTGLFLTHVDPPQVIQGSRLLPSDVFAPPEVFENSIILSAFDHEDLRGISTERTLRNFQNDQFSFEHGILQMMSRYSVVWGATQRLLVYDSVTQIFCINLPLILQ